MSLFEVDSTPERATALVFAALQNPYRDGTIHVGTDRLTAAER